ncbi:MAG: Stp1/IreP family PP2C-type Ser/Thr phosphatase [Armatimonadota bacterium]
MADENEITAPFEVETLQAAWTGRLPAHPRLHAYLVCGAKTDLGRVRENNEDKFDSYEPDDPRLLATKGRVYAVADGMGGHSAGQVAAELSLNVFIRSLFADENPDLEASLRSAVREANAYVVDVARTVPGRNGMGATLTAVVVRDDDLFIAQVGDSRCYLLRDGQLEQLTEDHSWVAEQVRSGAMSEEQAEQSPFRNVITRSMGGAAEVEPDLTAVKLQVGDRFLLCSDGLSGMVPAAGLAEILSTGSASAAAWSLVDRANQAGGRDNITALVLDVVDLQPWPAEEGEAEETALLTASENSNGHSPTPALELPKEVESPAAVPAASAPDGKGGFVRRLFGRS